MKKSITLLLMFVSIGTTSLFSQNAPTVEEYGEIIEKMMTEIKSLKTLKYTFIKNERYEGKIVESEQLVKQNVSPKKIYMKLIKGPNSGTELWFEPGKNKGNARVSRSSFIPTISLSPFSDLVRDKQRNTLYELGFDYMGGLIYQNYLKYKDKGADLIKDGWAKYDGIIKYEGRNCHKVTMTDKNYKIVDYTVLQGESLRSIAKKLLLDEYGLIELNGKGSIKVGQVIKVPTTFCKEILVYVDELTFLPMYIKVWDDKGLAGEYAYKNLILNPTFAADEFSEDGSMY